jgi:hypothetical protein
VTLDGDEVYATPVIKIQYRLIRHTRGIKNEKYAKRVVTGDINT